MMLPGSRSNVDHVHHEVKSALPSIWDAIGCGVTLTAQPPVVARTRNPLASPAEDHRQCLRGHDPQQHRQRINCRICHRR